MNRVVPVNPYDEAVTARHGRQISAAFAAQAAEHREKAAAALADSALLARGLSITDLTVTFHEREAAKLQRIADLYAVHAERHQARAVA